MHVNTVPKLTCPGPGIFQARPFLLLIREFMAFTGPMSRVGTCQRHGGQQFYDMLRNLLT